MRRLLGRRRLKRRDRQLALPERVAQATSLRQRRRVLSDPPTEAVHGLNLIFTVTNRSQMLRLHARNYAKVDFWTDGWIAPANFNPCKDLKGILVRVSFVPAAGSGNDGEVQKIEVRQQPTSSP